MNGHDFDGELRDAKAAALEAEVRAQNCERALEHLRDEIASLRAVALGTPEHAGCVPLAAVQQLLAKCEERYAGGGLQAGADVLDELAFFVIAQGAAAQAAPCPNCDGQLVGANAGVRQCKACGGEFVRAEGGETGGG